MLSAQPSFFISRPAAPFSAAREVITRPEELPRALERAEELHAARYRAENPDDFEPDPPDPSPGPVADTPEPQTAAPESGGGYVKVVTITPWKG